MSSSEDSSASLFKRLWRPSDASGSSGHSGFTGGFAGVPGMGGTLAGAAPPPPPPPPRSIKTSSMVTSVHSASSTVPHSSAMSMTSASKAHPAPVKTQAQAPGSPISHPEMCFSPTDVGIWEVERPRKNGAPGGNSSNFSVGTGTGPRGFFSSILGGGGGGGGSGGGGGGSEGK